MAEWFRQVPGLRSGKRWKKAVALAGYLLILLFLLAGLAGNGAYLLFSLWALAVVLLASNGWNLRDRLPVFGSPRRLVAGGGWVALSLFGLLSLSAGSPSPQGNPTAVPGSREPTRQAAQPATPPAQQTQSVPRATAATTAVMPSPTALPTASAPTPTVAVTAYREVAAYRAYGTQWKAIVVPPGIKPDELITLSRALHRKEPTTPYRIFDDESQVKQYVDWATSEGKVFDADGKAKTIDQCIDVAYCSESLRLNRVPYPFPEAWLTQHDVGMINRMLDGRSASWQLLSRTGEVLAPLD